MVPLCAHARTAAPSTKQKRTALAVHPEPTGLKNKREAFKVSSRQMTPLHSIEPGCRRKVVSDGSKPMGHNRSRWSNPTRARLRSRELFMNKNEQDWPALPLKEWEDTFHTLHMWTQIIGKIRL